MSVIVFQLLTKNNHQQHNSAASTTVNNNTETGKAISTPAIAEKEIEKGKENSHERN